MARSQRQSAFDSGGAGRNGHSGGRRSPREHLHGNYTSGNPASASTSGGYAHESNRDSSHVQVTRSPRPDPAYLSRMVNDPALSTAPFPPHPQNQAPHPYHAQHQSFWTDHASTHLRISPYPHEVPDRAFHPSPTRRAPSEEELLAQRDRERYQPPVGGYYPNQAAGRDPGPYDPVGYVRRDGEVFDPYALQRRQDGYYASNGASR